MAREFRKPTRTNFREFDPKEVRNELDLGQEHVWEIDTKFAVGWLPTIADSEAFRENNIYPKGV